MLYVEGLRVNLLSISKICDQDFMVLFSKGKCFILNESGKKLISRVHTLDSCYGLVPNAEIVCNSIRLPNEDLWHQRMGHASYEHQSIVSKHESVLGMPTLSRVSNVVCGPCKKNRVIQEMARAKLHNKDVARNLWGEAVNTACHTVN